jgi:L-malate glycosyltransferase
LIGHRVALFVGRLEHEKGTDVLLDAWTQVRQSLPDALLLLVGDGGLRSSLEACATPDVRFAGLADDPLPYYQAADCFVLSSRSEGLPNAVLEAMATGLPVVATAVGGVPDVLHHGKEGLLVEPCDPTALAAALIDMLDRPDRERMGNAGRNRVVRDFALERTADRLAELYRRLADRDLASIVGTTKSPLITLSPGPRDLRHSDRSPSDPRPS